MNDSNRKLYAHSFSKRLRVLMIQKELKARDLSKLMNVSLESAYKWINGSSLPNVYNAAKLCRVLEVDANEFIGVKR